MLTAALYQTYKKLGVPGPDGKPGMPNTFDTAVLSIAPPSAAAVGMLIGDFALGGLALLRGMGIGLRRLPAGIAGGVIGALAIVPPTYVVVWLIDWIYMHVHFQHPSEHELLKVMHESQSQPQIQWMLIFAAAIVAPMVEELFFRGHLQTIIRRSLVALTLHREDRKAYAFHGFPVEFPGDWPLHRPDPLPPIIAGRPQIHLADLGRDLHDVGSLRPGSSAVDGSGDLFFIAWLGILL